jgi:hypothetical protein
VNPVAFGATVRLSLLLFCNTNPVPKSPEIVPPTVYVVVVQATLTVLTSAIAVPAALLTTQPCVGLEGWAFTVTL